MFIEILIYDYNCAGKAYNVLMTVPIYEENSLGSPIQRSSGEMEHLLSAMRENFSMGVSALRPCHGRRPFRRYIIR